MADDAGFFKLERDQVIEPARVDSSKTPRIFPRFTTPIASNGTRELKGQLDLLLCSTMKNQNALLHSRKELLPEIVTMIMAESRGLTVMLNRTVLVVGPANSVTPELLYRIYRYRIAIAELLRSDRWTNWTIRSSSDAFVLELGRWRKSGHRVRRGRIRRIQAGAPEFVWKRLR